MRTHRKAKLNTESSTLIGEPGPTQADLHFRLFSIPVRIHPFFWAVSAILGLRGSEGDPVRLLIWVVAVFISILIHELGHALVAKYFGEDPWITLYSFGGLASYRPTRHDWRIKVAISLAGPAAGFLFIGLVMALIYGTGHDVWFVAEMPWMHYVGFQNEKLDNLISFLWFINLFWGLVNLLPIYPLDGGQIAREMFVQGDPGQGIRNSLYLSIFSAVGMAIYGGLRMESIFIALMFGYFAFNNYQLLQQYQGGGGYGGRRGW